MCTDNDDVMTNNRDGLLQSTCTSTSSTRSTSAFKQITTTSRDRVSARSNDQRLPRDRSKSVRRSPLQSMSAKSEQQQMGDSYLSESRTRSGRRRGNRTGQSEKSIVVVKRRRTRPKYETRISAISQLEMVSRQHSSKEVEKAQPEDKKKKTIKMCHQSAASRLLVAFATICAIVSLVQATSRSQSEFDSSLEDRLLAAGDEFTPLRMSSAAAQQQPRPAPSTATSSSRQTNERRADGSNPKFTRLNELDVFLDDMNHNELRAVATGKPIGDYLFQARPLTGAETGAPQLNHQQQQQQQSHERLRNAGSTGSTGHHQVPSAVAKSNNNSSTHLDVSQSEQQIYSECALILQRTYVKNIDNPKHQLVPFGKTEQACISYKHIDKAVEQAKHMLKFKELAKRRKKQKPKLPALDVIHKTLEPPQDLIAAIGELNMATTQILANQFDLSNDELLNGLPLIDMSKTKFWPLCPALVKQDIKCELSRFRTLTGHCNNLKHPTWGAAMTPFARYLPPVHPDGIWVPRKSIITETVFDISPGPRSGAEHDEHSSSQPRPVFGDPMPPLMMAPPPPMIPGEQLASAASVQFASHVRPEEAELASMMQMPGSPHGPLMPPPPPPQAASHRLGQLAAPPAVHFPKQQPTTTTMSAPQQPPPPPTTMMHFHESHSPAKPYLASSYPAQMSRPALKLLTSETRPHHRGHQSRSLALELPSARLVTSIVHRDIELPSHDLSILFMSWGQLLDHDMSRAAQSPPSIKCCTPEDGKPKHKLCLPIQVPADDPFYSKHNVQCLEFRRTLAGLRPNCVLGPRVHQNAITSPIDANFVYGSSQAQSDGLRLFQAGRLRDRDWFKAESLKPLLPAQDVEPDTECIARPKDLFCFLAGDVRVNEQTHLTVLHTIYMREHNRIAEQLADLNPHWDDERLFQETRHIVAAGVQHVMINEYLPLLIGKKMAELYNLTAVHHADPKAAGLHWHGYDPSVTTSVSNSFAAAAFRQGHTFIQSSFERYNKFHEFVSSERLRHLFKRPFLLYQPGVMDELVAGMINQPSQSYDPFISEDVSGHLFQPPELAFGHDLAAINLQRGREQGLPGYNLFREWCGLPRAETFDQLEPYLTNHTAFHYSRLYKHVDDIDLWSGGISERKLPGAAIGPTFACIIARQFSNTRRGDRFWYENPGLPSSFSSRQLAEIRKVSLAKILCANSDDLPTFQRWAFRMAHPVLNPRIPCDQLPQMDLRAWQEE